jgi:hypothetical protein
MSKKCNCGLILESEVAGECCMDCQSLKDCTKKYPLNICTFIMWEKEITDTRCKLYKDFRKQEGK